MGIKNVALSLFGVLYASVKAPLWALDVPSLGKVTVSSVTVVPLGDSSNPNDGSKWVDMPHPQLRLEGKARGRYKMDWNWKVDIDIDAQVLERADWHALTPKRDGSHGWDFLIMLLGIPGLIVASPVLVPWWLLRALLSKLTGMDLHQLVAWIKLRGQVPSEHRALVLRALRSMNNGAHWQYRSLRREQQKELQA